MATAALLLVGVAKAAGVPGQGTWESTLLGRDINGRSLDASSASAVFLYDTALNITWLRDASAGGVNDWYGATSWANTLKVGKFSGWRLPMLTPLNGWDYQYEFSNNGSTDFGEAKTGTGWGLASEMGHLFYVTLGNRGFCTPNDVSPQRCDEQSGWGLTNTGSFQNLLPSYYWSGQEYPPGWTVMRRHEGWDFVMSYGGQLHHDADYAWNVLAVRPGDVAMVPEPDTYVLLLLGLTGLAVARRHVLR